MTWFNTLTDERPALLTLAIFVPVRATLADGTEIRGVVIDHDRTNGNDEVTALVVDIDDFGDPLEIPQDRIVVDLDTDAGFLHALGCYVRWRVTANYSHVVRIETPRGNLTHQLAGTFAGLYERAIVTALQKSDRDFLVSVLVAASRSSA